MRRSRIFWLCCLISGVIISLTFLLPLFIIIIQSLSPTLSIIPEYFTLRWYQMKFDSIFGSLGITFLVAICSSLLSLLYMLPATYAISKRDFPGRRLFDQAIILPNMIPGVIFGVALLRFFYSAGLQFIHPLIVLIIVHSVVVIPYIARPILASFKQVDQALENAAMSLGANELRTFKDVVFPSIKPGVFSGLILAFTRSSGDFVITLFFTNPDYIPLSIRVYQSTSYGIPQLTSAIAVTLMILATMYIAIMNFVLKADIQ